MYNDSESEFHEGTLPGGYEIFLQRIQFNVHMSIDCII